MSTTGSAESFSTGAPYRSTNGDDYFARSGECFALPIEPAVGRVGVVARRFQLSVPKRRGDDDPWFRIGSLDVTTTVLAICLNVAVMVVYAVDKASLIRLIMARQLVTNGEVWRLVTWPFATVPTLNAAFMLGFFWFVGRDLEGQFGRVRFAKFLATIAGVVLLLALALDEPLGGFRLIVTAAFIAYIAENPRRPFFFGIPAWILGAVYVGIDVLQFTSDRQSKLIVLLFGAIGTALILLRGYGWGSEVPWVPRVQIPPILGGPVRPGGSPGRSVKGTKTSAAKGPKPAKRRRGSGGATVVTGPWGESGTGSATDAAGASPRLPRTGPVTQADVDLVLDKVAANGLASLTEDERAVLEHASRTLRDRSVD